jgi:hypothetical protein
MVYGREADGGYEPRVEVVGQVQREYRGHYSVIGMLVSVCLRVLVQGPRRTTCCQWTQT